jgi:hypothetical protein
MANKQKEEREQKNVDKYGTKLPPETTELTTEDLLRQIEGLRKDLKHGGLQDTSTEFFLEEDGTQNFEKKPNGAYKNGFHPNCRGHQFVKGESGNGSGGRPKGSKNKKTLRQEAIDKGQFTPAEFLLSVVNDENASMTQRISAADKAAKFYDASLSSIEVHTDEEHDAPFNIFLGNIEDKDDEKGSPDE